MDKKGTFRTKVITALLCASLTLFLFPLAASAEYPERPIKLIVPYSPGGVSDLTWRGLTERMGEVLGHQWSSSQTGRRRHAGIHAGGQLQA